MIHLHFYNLRPARCVEKSEFPHSAGRPQVTETRLFTELLADLSRALARLRPKP